MNVSCSDYGRVFREYERWTVVTEGGRVLGRLCGGCFDRHVSGLVMPWDRVPPEVPMTWREVWRRYRIALGARGPWDTEVFVDGTLYRWHGSSPEPAEITDMDDLGAGFRKTGETIAPSHAPRRVGPAPSAGAKGEMMKRDRRGGKFLSPLQQDPACEFLHDGFCRGKSTLNFCLTTEGGHHGQGTD